MKKYSILSLAAVLTIAASLPVAAVEHDVTVDYFSLSPNPVYIKTGDVVYWVEDSSSFLGPYIITGPWGYDVAPYGIKFNVPGTYSYTAESAWGGGGWGGTVVVSPNLPPNVSITNPTNGTVFTAPASFSFEANATDPNVDDVWDVEFWVNSTMVDDVYAAPYSTMVTNLAPGTYTLKAIVWDYSYAKATNSITIQVVSPPPITLGSCTISNGKVTFAMNGMAAGTTNVLLCSSNLVSWWPISTNVSDGTPLNVTNDFSGRAQFFRVMQLQ